MRLLALCTIPRSNPGDRDRYVRRNGPFTLIMIAGGEVPKLPYGTLPRLILAWVCTEAVRTQSRTLGLGRSLAEFMRKLDITDDSGGSRGDRTRLRNQMQRLFRSTVELSHQTEHGVHAVADRIASGMHLWWNPRRPNEPVLWDSTIELGEKFFNEIIACPVPIDINILNAMKRSPLGLDLYMWLTYRLFGLSSPCWVSWQQIYQQFGLNPAKATTRTVDNFRTDVIRELGKLKDAWPALDYRLAVRRGAPQVGCMELERERAMVATGAQGGLPRRHKTDGLTGERAAARSRSWSPPPISAISSVSIALRPDRREALAALVGGSTRALVMSPAAARSARRAPQSLAQAFTNSRSRRHRLRALALKEGRPATPGRRSGRSRQFAAPASRSVGHSSANLY